MSEEETAALDERNKVQALQIAARDTSRSAEDVVAAAEAFLKFLQS